MQIFVDPVLAAGLRRRPRGPIGGAGAHPGVFGRIVGDPFEGGEGFVELAQPPFRQADRPPVADLAPDRGGAGQVVVVVGDARRLGRIVDPAAAGNRRHQTVPGPPDHAAWPRRLGRAVRAATQRQRIDAVGAGQVGIGLQPGRQLFIGGDVVGVEQALELDLAQQHPVLGLARGGPRRLDVPAPQGVEGGGVGNPVGGTQGHGAAGTGARIRR